MSMNAIFFRCVAQVLRLLDSRSGDGATSRGGHAAKLTLERMITVLEKVLRFYSKEGQWIDLLVVFHLFLLSILGHGVRRGNEGRKGGMCMKCDATVLAEGVAVYQTNVREPTH